MVKINDLEEYIECEECKAFKIVKDIVKIKKKQNLIQMFRKEESFKLVCKECVSK